MERRRKNYSRGRQSKPKSNIYLPVQSLLEKVDFGDIDGLYDRKLNDYFLDKDYWNNLVDGRKFFVIGRKGTGKSAIYNWIYSNQKDKGVIVSNLSFKNFPFEKLLSLIDDDFSRPNQYQSVWRNIILSEICKHIVIDGTSIVDDTFKEIKRYVEHKFGTDLTDLHKRVTKQTTRTDSGLFIQRTGVGTSQSQEKELGDELSNITMINSKLEELVKAYLKTSESSKYIIQFDQLDDNYTVYIENDQYFQSIISLFKVVYDLNQTFYQIDVPVKIIAYLRSDIFYEINNYDAESARWDQHKQHLNWAIINRSDWANPDLLQLLNKRIRQSLPDLTSRSEFHTIFSPDYLHFKDKNSKQSVFSFIVRRSFHRPRDIIQFCIKIQEESKKWGKLNMRTVFDAEKEYSSWLLSEVANEFGPLINDKNVLYEFLRTIGERYLSFEEFLKEYSPYESGVGLNAIELLKLLYRLGIVLNVNIKGRHREYFGIVRNEKSSFNQQLKISLHQGFNKGLHTYTQ